MSESQERSVFDDAKTAMYAVSDPDAFHVCYRLGGDSSYTGNPLPENAASWIEEHPQATLCGEVIQTTENEFSQSVYLSNAYLIYQSQKIIH